MVSTKHPEYQYLDLLQETLQSGEEQVDRGTGVKTYSLFGRQIRFDLTRDFPLLTTKRIYWNGVLRELYWFMSGQSNIKYLVDHNVHIWDGYPYKIYLSKVKSPAKGEARQRRKNSKLSKEEFIAKIRTDKKFALQWGELPHIYGESWRRWPGEKGRKVDQLGWVIKELREDPNAHNALVNSWNPEYLYAMAPKGKGARFPICHNMYQVNIKKGRVCLQLYQRSADIFLGVPFNIASYALLTIIIAKILGREPGEFIHTFGDVHIYENHFAAAKEELKRKPRPFPQVKINGSLKSLSQFKPEMVELIGYDPYATIKAQLTVAGGLVEEKR